MNEYEHEPVRGLPGHLPDGERMLWQGSPEWWSIARGVMHLRGVAIYFLVIMAWAGITVARGDGIGRGITAAAWVAPVALAALGILCGLSWWIARTTVYTLTDKRLVLRFGVALPMAVNVPFSKVESVAMTEDADGNGNIAFGIGERPSIGYFMMWPHVRPWWLSRTQPMIRGIREPQRVAGLLKEALAKSVASPSAETSIAAASGKPMPVSVPAARPGSAGPLIGQQAVAGQAR